MDEQPSQEWIDAVNADMAMAALDYMRRGLSELGVPRGTFTDDQFDNFVAMYNRRGDLVTSVNSENNILRDRISNMEEVLVTVANWPNPDNHPQIQAMKVWAASVVDPTKVTMLKALTSK
jgi:hypothetical protein